jgi:glycosyltransferase involved in cell wall biosynthesis
MVREPLPGSAGVIERRIRVTYVIDKMHRAGAQVHVGQLAGALDRARFEPEVLCLLAGGPVADELRARGIPVDVLGLGRLYAPRGLAGLFRLSRRLRGRRVDVVHTYLISANVYGTLAARLAGVPAIVTSRRDMGFSRNWRLRLLEEYLINPLVDRVVAVTPAVAERTRRERGLGRERIVTVENGVDLPAWDPDRQPRAQARTELGLAPEQVAVGVVGHLSPVKGHADFLRAAALVAAEAPAARFYVVGDGPLRPSLEALAASLGVAEKVVFTGASADVARVLAALDVVVLPSHSEGMSNALLEAMAMARPVVATAVGGNTDVVRDRVTGRLVPPHDPPALAAALRDLLASPAARTALGRAARLHVTDQLSLPRMVKRYEDLYLGLVPS